MLALALLLSCHRDDPPPGCGDGVLDADEACDHGDRNALAPDACRPDCTLPRCGDGVTDRRETCDDGDAEGGDGCTPTCAAEGALAAEPDDDPLAAPPWPGRTVYGSLAAGDRDCLAVDLPECASISARLVGDCSAPAVLGFYDPTGARVAVGAPGADRCAALDPRRAPGARFAAAGTFAVCVEGLLGAEVPAWALEIAVDDEPDSAWPTAARDDADGDGRPARCDPDRDGDGVLDAEDDCPDVPDGPDAPPLAPDADGFLRQWLSLGPITGTVSPDTCQPSLDELPGGDAAAAPALGDRAGDLQWTVLWSGSSRLEYLTDYGHVDAPREVYNAVYLRSATERDLTLALGPDDGVRAWWNGVEVLDVATCQGTVIDQFQASVHVEGGWNRLLVKVRDQGGGWGNYARLLDGGEPVLELEVSLDPDGPWESRQSDLDGDGIGDVCDDTPAG